MSLWHRGWQRRVSLLAMEALEGEERAAAEAHLRGCARCAAELAALRAALALVDQDPLREAEPPLPPRAMATRVLAAVDARARAPRPALAAPQGSWRLALATGLVVAVALATLRPPPRRIVEPDAPPQVEVSEEGVRRMERELAREQAVRYLAEAQDVLLTVTASPADCDRGPERLDVGAETRRSRELLARRALVVDLEGDAVASARPVLEDVEHLLREVAALPSCVRAGQVDAIHREMARRHLLMKIDLMTRELQG
ncbi:MAG TPA: zf-HC2 domain-containing protein [Vicinamibacteria bacterium]